MTGTLGSEMAPEVHYPDNTTLDEAQRRKVLEKARQRGVRCKSCGSEDFEVGDALYLGFLFLDEDTDTHMVALTCTNPDCDAPRMGIRLRGAEFLKEPTRDGR